MVMCGSGFWLSGHRQRQGPQSLPCPLQFLCVHAVWTLSKELSEEGLQPCPEGLVTRLPWTQVWLAGAQAAQLQRPPRLCHTPHR